MAPLTTIKRMWIAGGACAALALAISLPPALYGAGFAYKNYILRKEGGREILCDPYVVKKNDWVLKIFKLRGEIAQNDFPHFLRLFRRINPHIRNINTIRPGQHILIPLKEMIGGPMAEEPSGVVQVPFLDLTRDKKPDPVSLPDSTAGRYRVRKGDCISKLIAGRFGDYGTQAYKDGLNQFRIANPGISDLDQLYVGQIIQLPGVDDVDGDASAISGSAVPGPAFEPVRTGYDLYQAARQGQPSAADVPPPVLKKAASLLQATLLDQGVFYFPRPGIDDLPLDMSQVPVMTLGNGRRLLFPSSSNSMGSLVETVRNHWKSASVITLPPGADLEAALDAVSRALSKEQKQTSVDVDAEGLHFTIQARWILDLSSPDHGTTDRLCITMIDTPSQRTPDSLVRYLSDRQIIIRDVARKPAESKGPRPDKSSSDHPMEPIAIAPDAPRKFVPDLIRALGYTYAGGVTITFPYAGIQIEAVSNLATTSSGIPLFIDYEELFGDAVEAIKKSGFRIVQITSTDRPRSIVKKILSALDLKITENPRIIAADRPDRFNTTVVVPGILASNDNSARLLVTDLALSPDIGSFLCQKGIRVVILAPDRNTSQDSDLNG